MSEKLLIAGRASRPIARRRFAVRRARLPQEAFSSSAKIARSGRFSRHSRNSTNATTEAGFVGVGKANAW